MSSARQPSTRNAPVPIRAKATPEELAEGLDTPQSPQEDARLDVPSRQDIFTAAVMENLKAELGAQAGTIVELKTQIMMMSAELAAKDQHIAEMGVQVKALTDAIEQG